MITDVDPEMDSTRDYFYFKHFPSNTSTKNMLNFAQMLDNKGILAEFD